MTPELALFLLGVITLAELVHWVYRKVRPNAGPVFA